MNQRPKYKRHRLKNYDYSTDGIYHIVIDTKDCIKEFGKIGNDDDEIELSAAGKVVKEEWFKTAEIRKEVTLGEYKIMPDHFHGIITIGNPNLPVRIPPELQYLYIPFTPDFENKFGPQRKNLGRIVGSFKAACTSRIHTEINPDFDLQVSFFDEIIRDLEQLKKANAYVKNNIVKWKRKHGFK